MTAIRFLALVAMEMFFLIGTATVLDFSTILKVHGDGDSFSRNLRYRPTFIASSTILFHDSGEFTVYDGQCISTSTVTYCTVDLQYCRRTSYCTQNVSEDRMVAGFSLQPRAMWRTQAHSKAPGRCLPP